ncbi:MAG: HigA family addiction module antidote protein [Gemmatimonadales bacterium]|nr:HigA family addiction module antidote protein [Gemmatimonadales bacterium]
MFMRAVHPGEILKEELDEAGVTPTELARQIDVPPNQISQIIAGKRAVTGDTALRLGHWFGMEPQFWLNLQGAFDLRMAQENAGQEIARLPVRADDGPLTAAQLRQIRKQVPQGGRRSVRSSLLDAESA